MAEAAAAPEADKGLFVGIDLGVLCVTASSPADDRYAVKIDTNDVSGRSTPGCVSYDGKQRHVGMAAEGRLMSAPKQTLTHLPMALSAASQAKRAEQYLWLFPTEDGKLGPVTFDGDEFSTEPCGPLSALLRTLTSYAAGAAMPKELCVAVHDYMSDEELAVVRDALDIAGFKAQASVLRQSDAVAASFAQSKGSNLLPEGTDERTVAFVDIGVSHGTVSVVKYSRPAPAEGQEAAEVCPTADFLYRRTDESMGVQALIQALFGEAKKRIEDKHKCKVKTQSKAGLRLQTEVVHTLKQLSMLPDADLHLEALMPEGPDGPEIDVSLHFTREMLETTAASMLSKLKEVLAEAIAAAPEGSIEGVEVVGGGGRVPAVQALVKAAAGEACPLRFGLDGASCIAAGAAAWAAGRRCVPAVALPEAGGLPAADLAAAREREGKIDTVNAEEVARLEKRNTLESYVYQVRDWLHGKDGALLKPDALGPYLDKVVLWFEDMDMAEEPTSLATYAAKMEEVQTHVKTEGAAFFEAKEKQREEQEKALEKASAEERERRKELGMDFDKDERTMKKEDRFRLATKNKEEGNDMFKAQKFDDAIRRYKKAVEHVTRPEVVSNCTPDEAEEAKKIKVSCHLNSAQCYIKAADTAFASGGKNGAEPYYKKARTSCDDVLDLDEANIKAIFRRSLCNEKMGELDVALRDLKKGLAASPEDPDLKKSQERLAKLLARQKEGQKKVFSKMFG